MATNGEERFPLSDAVLATLKEIEDNVRAVQAGAQMAHRYVLVCFARQQQIKGQFQLAENGRELVIRHAQEGVSQQ
jgi:hypothetical protein